MNELWAIIWALNNRMPPKSQSNLSNRYHRFHRRVSCFRRKTHRQTQTHVHRQTHTNTKTHTHTQSHTLTHRQTVQTLMMMMMMCVEIDAFFPDEWHLKEALTGHHIIVCVCVCVSVRMCMCVIKCWSIIDVASILERDGSDWCSRFDKKLYILYIVI